TNAEIGALWSQATDEAGSTYHEPFRFSVVEAVNYFFKHGYQGKPPVQPPASWKGKKLMGTSTKRFFRL
ncbi:MAG: hypothetical protein M3R43_03135, partial [Acidobacteriota bacterium]|nr:hypothetical protein [Acidobacteriota bacterium]